MRLLVLGTPHQMYMNHPYTNHPWYSNDHVPVKPVSTHQYHMSQSCHMLSLMSEWYLLVFSDLIWWVCTFWYSFLWSDSCTDVWIVQLNHYCPELYQYWMLLPFGPLPTVQCRSLHLPTWNSGGTISPLGKLTIFIGKSLLNLTLLLWAIKCYVHQIT